MDFSPNIHLIIMADVCVIKTIASVSQVKYKIEKKSRLTIFIFRDFKDHQSLSFSFWVCCCKMLCLRWKIIIIPFYSIIYMIDRIWPKLNEIFIFFNCDGGGGCVGGVGVFVYICLLNVVTKRNSGFRLGFSLFLYFR